ncbi:uncharacterized protein A1O9_00484 [Exophiala aquamarina CBS 119918]|uniref:Choline transport protein n=1 Tax=Exophiala aquamarina CBS 119918 TaxID=1182545 RepID=A0A072PRL0_9EURO|nr:uncharacterized protein A1O9_00484 [Exophiala aquamarina CBS 119918]KEF62511.1 hypothetical protein A1O9_00484 [Exophiala aquamarina CBS 119918]
MADTIAKNEHGEIEQTTSVADGDIAAIHLSKAPVKANIGPLSIVALGFNICNSWAGLSASLQIALLQGGPAGLLYGMFVSTFATFADALTLAELASVYPTAGGQYHFVSILCPDKINLFTSYFCGIFSIFSWIAIGSAVLIIPAEQISALASAHYPEYEPQDWHKFLMYQAMLLLVLVSNTFVLKRSPRFHDVGFAFTITLFFATAITLLARSTPKASSTFVWTSFINQTGWSDGLCFFSGLLTTCFQYAGLDGALHLAEECKDPQKTVPRAMIAAVTIGFCTAFPFAIIVLYSVADIDAILNTTGYLTLEVYTQGMRSQAAATVFTAVGVLIAWFVLNAVLQTSSRITWSFARDNALTFSKHLVKIHPKLEVPVFSLLLNYAILVVCGCIFLASRTAFNAILSSCVVLQQISFIMPAALLIYRRRSSAFLPENRAFRLPSIVGWTANIVVVVLGLIFTVVFCIPPFRPVTPSSMNYSSVMIGIAFFLVLINWFVHGKKHYHGPRIEFHGPTHHIQR